MVCPYCSHESKVTNSRLQKRANNVWRRRKCLKCSATWTTLERLEASTVFKIGQSGHLRDFTPETLLISLYEALRHKNTAAIDAQYIAKTVTEQLTGLHQAVIPTSTIAATAYDILRRYDPTAAAVYAAVHQSPK